MYLFLHFAAYPDSFGMNKKTGIRVLIAGIGTVVLGSVYLIKGGTQTSGETLLPDTRENILSDMEQDVSDSSHEDSFSETKNVKTIFVYVSGEVRNPGVYELSEDSRVFEAIEMAGGFTGDADSDSLNLAGNLHDGDHIHVGKPGESVSSQSGMNGTSSEKEGLININTATSEELESLSGIGPAKAAAIIAYREEHGAFKKITDLLKVPGIGEKLYEMIKNRITV